MDPPIWSGLRFVLLMVACYLGCHHLYQQVPDAVLRDSVYLHGLVRPAAALVNLVSAAEQASAEGNLLRSPRALLAVVRGCDGAGALFLVIAAVLAFPAGWRLRVIGLLGGALLVYVLNLTRLVGLYFVAAYRGDWFAPLHTYVVPGLVVVVVAICYLQWVTLAMPQAHAGR